jgi:hypothetical protein
MPKEREFDDILPRVTGDIQEALRHAREGLLVYVPGVGRPYGRAGEDEPWGQSIDNFWMELPPGWVQSGGDIWRPDEELVQFGGLLGKDLMLRLAEVDARIIKGSVQDRRWVIAVPRDRLEETRELLIHHEAEFVGTVSPRRRG